jgi:hypothetical protein
MSIELLSAEVDLEPEEEHRNEGQLMKNMEQEIECPRCHDIMTFSSDFECDLLLIMK